MSSVFGIIGFPLSHSFSPAYFRKKFSEIRIDAVYKPFPLQNIHELKPLLKTNRDIAGLNVTIPYKESVIPLLDSVDPVARAIGAVNCIKVENGMLKGYNTDVTGFEQSLKPLLLLHHTSALILGNGGSSKAVIYVLARLGIPFLRVSRYLAKGDITYEELSAEIMAAHQLIINTTPLGMYPNTEEAPPIPYQFINKGHLLYDLIYNPAETRFLSQGKEKGAATKNGFEMLTLQAEASWDIWNA